MLGFVLSRYPFWYSSVVIGVKLMLKLRSWRKAYVEIAFVAFK
jgi:hypothetical protein